MAAPQTNAPATLRISRTYAAAREKVFQAWTDPEKLRKWFAPSGEFETRVVELDAKPGGRYRIEMSEGGKTHIAAGVYREIRPPEKLVFTWRWEDDPEKAADTLVTIELFDRGGMTELVLTHERFPNEASRDDHNKGWMGCLAQLEKYLS